ncbi:MAG: hypothetical protein H7Y37_08960 [Anaerolineae bacterium]|nr:hypothetical protein [Gloeobacterales cyanobacterium ES-bin-313]
MNEELFWSTIENAWNTAGGITKARQQLAQDKLSDAKVEELVEALNAEVIPSLLATLTNSASLNFSHLTRFLSASFLTLTEPKCRNRPTALTMAFSKLEGL